MSKSDSQRVLVSFIGKGIPAARNDETASNTHLGYRTAQYAFSDPKYCSEPTSLFGTALIHYFREVRRTPIERWLVLGSPQSNWDALIESVAERLWDGKLSQIYEEVHRAVRQENDKKAEKLTSEGCGFINPKLLNEWSTSLSEKLSPLLLECYLIGWSESTRSQVKMWQILNHRIPRSSELVLDITHGFRHQPMLLATMIVLMKHLDKFESVSFYYGALDMSQGNTVPTIRIDLFPDLLEYIRRLGVLHVTGDYESLGKYLLRDQPEMKKELEELAFKERANLDVPKAIVDKLVTQIEQWYSEDLVRETMKPILLSELKKHHAGTPWERAALRADEADKHHDYLTAYTLLWEAIVSVSVLLTQSNAQAKIDDIKARSEPIEKLLQHNYILQPEANTLHAFRITRNWMVHGTPQRNKKAKQALESSKDLRALYAEARQIFDKLLNNIRKSSQQSQPTSTDGA